MKKDKIFSMPFVKTYGGRDQLKCDGTRAETRFRLSAQTGRVHLNRRGRQFSRLLADDVRASAVVMMDTTCSEVVWRVLATHCIRQFPLHFPSRASSCAITYQLECKIRLICNQGIRCGEMSDSGFSLCTRKMSARYLLFEACYIVTL